MMKKKKGQLSIANVLNWIVLIFVVGILTLIVSPFINTIAEQVNNTMATIVMYAIVPILWLGVILTLMEYAQVRGPLRPY